MRKVEDKEEQRYIFSHGSLYGDRNADNYLELPDYVSFYTVDDVCFAGVRQWDDKYARIFDRYFVYPEARKSGIKYAEHYSLMAEAMIKDCGDLIPFISIEKQKAAALELADALGWHVLPEKHNTIDSMQWIILPGGHNVFQGSYLSTN